MERLINPQAAGFAGTRTKLREPRVLSWARRIVLRRPVASDPKLLVALAAILFMGSGLRADPLDTWHLRTSGTTANLNAITYGAGSFVAAGDAGTILVSVDGKNWNQSVSGLSTNLHGIAWGANRFIAVGNGGTISASSDAISWVPQVSPTTQTLKAVKWINGRFLAVGGNGTILESADGTSWTPRNPGTTYGFKSLAYGAGVFCVGAESSSNNGLISTSADGITWVNHPGNSFHTLYDMAYGAGRFVALTLRGQTQLSTDGAVWTAAQAGDTDYLFGITFAQGIFVAVGGPYSSGRQKVVTSPDGIQWLQRSVKTDYSPSLTSVVYGNGSFVAVGGKGLILQSAPCWKLWPPASVTSPGTSIQWTFTAESGRDYRLQCLDSSRGLGWSDLLSFTATNETVTLTDPTASNSPGRYYRVVSP